jgi:hypothetical protein
MELSKGIEIMLPVVSKLTGMLPAAASLIASRAPAIAARLGIATAKVSTNSLITMAKKNKITAAFIAYELYGAGSEIVREMAEADAAIADIVEQLGYQPDVVSETTSVNDIALFSEEFATIRDAADAVGGLNNLVRIRKALELSPATYQLYLTTREMAREIF